MINVVKGSPAESAGIKEGDVIISLAEQSMATINDIHRLLTADNIDKKIGIILLRDWTQKLELNVIPSQSSD